MFVNKTRSRFLVFITAKETGIAIAQPQVQTYAFKGYTAGWAAPPPPIVRSQRKGWSIATVEHDSYNYGESRSVKRTVLVVDDEDSILTQMGRAFEPLYNVLLSSREDSALSQFQRHRPPVVILDLALNPADPSDLGGLRLLNQILGENPSTRVIIVTGNDEDTNALRAIRLGAFDYYSKPIRLDEIQVMIQRAFHIHDLQQLARNSWSQPRNEFQGILGSSKSMQQVFDFIERVADSDVSVLIAGESGTGKELVAGAIHQQSHRREKPFVTVNCGAIPENLLETELFGHEKGAFTGAYCRKRGKFERAHSGTLFLDEIGELMPSLQVKLLRFLQDRRVERVGGIESLDLDVRIIAATNRDLKADMENHLFREDLYYRLRVVPLEIPPLRDRKDDLLTLANHFLKKYCEQYRKPLLSLSLEAETALLSYEWPGNVRELENVVSRAVVLSANAVLKPNDLGFSSGTKDEFNLKSAKRAIEKDFVKKALLRNNGVVSRAAKELGVSRVNLYELMHKYDIQVEDFKADRKRAKQQLHVKEVS